MTDSDIAKTEDWFRRAIPQPSNKNFHTQLGCHLEEVAEMLEQLDSPYPLIRAALAQTRTQVEQLGNLLKGSNDLIEIRDEVEFMDSLQDQIVTAVGTGYMKGYDMAGGHGETNRSNFSKFDVQGSPILNEQLKIQKGPGYFKPNLLPFLKEKPNDPSNGYEPVGSGTA